MIEVRSVVRTAASVAPLWVDNPSKLPKSTVLVDAFTDALRELFDVLHPAAPSEKRQSQWRVFAREHSGMFVWVYYPWRMCAVRTLDEERYFLLRTARNKNLITALEQRAYRDSVVGIAGLSVGSAVLSVLATSGGSKQVRISDPDIVSISNLNRIRATLPEVGLNKAVVAARAAWEIDPFLKIEVWGQGLTEGRLRQFILRRPRLNVFVDEMDNLKLKVLARKICRASRIPVVMATDNGDGIILDVERFDTASTQPIFHGLVRHNELRGLDRMNSSRWLKLAVKIMGPRYLTARHQDSLLEVGRTLVGPPQLGTAAAIAGAAVAFAIRRIVNKNGLPSGRYLVGLEEKLIPLYRSQAQQRRRLKHTRTFVREFARL
ncbi:ThiF family adenylyltransferase [Candidatus Parcubacteria bacterium]|nr:ThiF family adenylyltransferase [Candidatus Parcubacteria bacterium]